jgi:hypothetical protein
MINFKMHPRNPYRNPPDFAALADEYQLLKPQSVVCLNFLPLPMKSFDIKYSLHGYWMSRNQLQRPGLTKVGKAPPVLENSAYFLQTLTVTLPMQMFDGSTTPSRFWHNSTSTPGPAMSSRKSYSVSFDLGKP